MMMKKLSFLSILVKRVILQQLLYIAKSAYEKVFYFLSAVNKIFFLDFHVCGVSFWKLRGFKKFLINILRIPNNALFKDSSFHKCIR